MVVMTEHVDGLTHCGVHSGRVHVDVGECVCHGELVTAQSTRQHKVKNLIVWQLAPPGTKQIINY